MVCVTAAFRIDTAEDRHELFRELYESSFYSVAKFVATNGGSFEQAKDIFQEAIVVLYEKLVEEKTEILSPEAYVIGISKHLWNREIKDRLKRISLDDQQRFFELPDIAKSSVSERKLLSWLEHAGQRCLQLLKAFYYDKQSVTSIGQEFGYKSEHSTTVAKFKCLEKLRDEAKSKSLSYEDFTE